MIYIFGMKEAKKRNKNSFLTKRLNLITDDAYIKENLIKLSKLTKCNKFIHFDTIAPFAGEWDPTQNTKYLAKQILQESEYFLSFEKYTASNVFAALCGCKVIVLDKNKEFDEKIENLPDYNKGIAFGFENLQHANNTIHLLRDQIKDIENKQKLQVKDFVKLCYEKLYNLN